MIVLLSYRFTDEKNYTQNIRSFLEDDFDISVPENINNDELSQFILDVDESINNYYIGELPDYDTTKTPYPAFRNSDGTLNTAQFLNGLGSITINIDDLKELIICIAFDIFLCSSDILGEGVPLVLSDILKLLICNIKIIKDEYKRCIFLTIFQLNKHRNDSTVIDEDNIKDFLERSTEKDKIVCPYRIRCHYQDKKDDFVLCKNYYKDLKPKISDIVKKLIDDNAIFLDGDNYRITSLFKI